ncbi:hypothetical protein HYE67_008173 [Fusarium culmorum]|uniref:Uncharacterized protein n=1 Tax=Fusarium culmorum TaxID=5516 RepID=A0A7S8DCI0_FUSCU|nr:hypothetical protein HYE67_008173 [Fusarium culmorum]
MKRLWELVHYDFQPPLSDVNRRISILANKAASVTMPDLQKQARSRVETFLSSQTIPLSFQSNRDGRVLFIVDVFRPIWRTTVMFDGIRYLNCLSNKQDGKHFRPIKTQRGDIVNIYFASNHLGVVAMYFSKYGMSKQDWPGVWWSRLTLSKTHHLLRAYTDCLDCSKPGITGYSACMVDGDLVDLHCHIEGEDLEFYQDGGGDRLHAVWLYFPVEQGERIFEVWRRRKRPHFCRDIPMLRTNKGRVFVLGTHISQHDIVVKYDCITSFPTEKHARFWFCYREGCVDCLAFDTEDKRLENDPIVQLEGSSALCSSGLSNQRFATSATLKDVVEVVPCRSWAPGSTGIVGLLLTYSDGHRETVGQVRLDHLLEPMQVVPTGDMWLGIRLLPHGAGVVVEALRLIPSNGMTVHGGNTCEAGLRWGRVEWKGRLDWLFWYGRCCISWHAQAIPVGHINTVLEAQGGRGWETETPTTAINISP